MNRWVAMLVGAVVLGTAVPFGAAAAQPYRTPDGKPRTAFKIKDDRIAESSGMAASPRHKGIVYTHNDSAAGPQFFALDSERSPGRTRATFTVGGASNRDWEAMAAAGGYLYFGDIGDNNGTWDSITIYRVKEPKRLRDATVPSTAFRFRFKDGPRDAETLLVHPRTGRIYIADKDFGGSLYAAPKRPKAGRINVLKRVADAPPLATDGAFAPDGSSYVIRSYFSARLYQEVGDDEPVRIEMPEAEQAESITYTQDGKALLSGSEGAGSKVWEVPLTGAASPSPSGTPSPTAPAMPAEASPTFQLSRWAWTIWAVMGLGAIGIIVLLARSTR